MIRVGENYSMSSSFTSRYAGAQCDGTVCNRLRRRRRRRHTTKNGLDVCAMHCPYISCVSFVWSLVLVNTRNEKPVKCTWPPLSLSASSSSSYPFNSLLINYLSAHRPTVCFLFKQNARYSISWRCRGEFAQVQVHSDDHPGFLRYLMEILIIVKFSPALTVELPRWFERQHILRMVCECNVPDVR